MKKPMPSLRMSGMTGKTAYQKGETLNIKRAKDAAQKRKEFFESDTDT